MNQLRELAGGQEEFVQTMVDTFLEHTPVHLKELMEAYAAKDFIHVGAMAHKIKPSIDLFGISALTTSIREVERIGKSGSAEPELDELISQVNSTLEQVFESMRNH